MAKTNKRDEFLSLVPASCQRILDVGCGKGSLGLKLRDWKKNVTGIEIDEQLCSLAREKLDKVIPGDAEKIKLDFPESYFDCILYADVLEHLKEPLRLLKTQSFYLAKDGFVVASIPNIRYYKIINNLLFKGCWDYTDKGILDRTHLKFFTLRNIRELFCDAGYEIITVSRNIVASRFLKVLNFIFFGFLRDLLAYQYYIKAKKSPKGVEAVQKKRQIEKF